MIRLISGILCLLFLSGCVEIQQTASKETTELTILPPNEGPVAGLLKQTLTLERQDEEYQFLVIVRLEPSQTSLMALLPSGQPLFFVVYDGQQFQQENYSDQELPGKEILSILQFALWPKSSLQRHYSSEQGWFLKVSQQKRTLHQGHEELLLVRYLDENLIKVENHLHKFPLKLSIRTFEKEVQ